MIDKRSVALLGISVDPRMSARLGLWIPGLQNGFRDTVRIILRISRKVVFQWTP